MKVFETVEDPTAVENLVEEMLTLEHNNAWCVVDRPAEDFEASGSTPREN